MEIAADRIQEAYDLLKTHFQGPFRDTFLGGKTPFRNFLYEKMECSLKEAETLVETLERNERIIFTVDPRGRAWYLGGTVRALLGGMELPPSGLQVPPDGAGEAVGSLLITRRLRRINSGGGSKKEARDGGSESARCYTLKSCRGMPRIKIFSLSRE